MAIVLGTNSAGVKISVDMETMLGSKGDRGAAKSRFETLRKQFDVTYCSDGSYKDGLSTIAINNGRDRWLYRLGNNLSSALTELFGVVQALCLSAEELSTSNTVRKILIATDAQSVLRNYFSATTKNEPNQYTVVIGFYLMQFMRPCEVTLLWIPGHTGLDQNEIADRDAVDARQLPEYAILSPPNALLCRDTRMTKKNPWDLLHENENSFLSCFRDADQMLQEMELSQSSLNGDNPVEGFPEFSWCELCRNMTDLGVVQTAQHIFHECPALEQERQELQNSFDCFFIPYSMKTILAGFCIETTSVFLKLLAKKREMVTSSV